MATDPAVSVTDHVFDLAKQVVGGTTAVPKSIAKLIDTVGEQAGLYAAPAHIRRTAEAQAAAAVTMAKAEAAVAAAKLKGAIALEDIHARAEARVEVRETRRQRNIEAITGQAAQALRALPEAVSDQPVDQDWIANFFDACQDVGDEQMQVLWGRLLSGEVAAPGSFSRRAIAVTKVLSKEDAHLFTRLCGVVWETPSGLTPLIDRHWSAATGWPVSFHLVELIRLETLGLIKFNTTGSFKYTWTAPLYLYYYGHGHRIERAPGRASDRPVVIALGSVLLTDVGNELAPIAGSEPNEEYRQKVVIWLRKPGLQIDDGPPAAPDSAAAPTPGANDCGRRPPAAKP